MSLQPTTAHPALSACPPWRAQPAQGLHVEPCRGAGCWGSLWPGRLPACACKYPESQACPRTSWLVCVWALVLASSLEGLTAFARLPRPAGPLAACWASRGHVPEHSVRLCFMVTCTSVCTCSGLSSDPELAVLGPSALWGSPLFFFF